MYKKNRTAPYAMSTNYHGDAGWNDQYFIFDYHNALLQKKFGYVQLYSWLICHKTCKWQAVPWSDAAFCTDATLFVQIHRINTVCHMQKVKSKCNPCHYVVRSGSSLFIDVLYNITPIYSICRQLMPWSNYTKTSKMWNRLRSTHRSRQSCMCQFATFNRDRKLYKMTPHQCQLFHLVLVR